MGIEIERKFLVKNDDWKKNVSGVRYCQGYIQPGSGITVRVRTFGNQGFLTVKGPGAGITRLEYEYEIPLQDAREMLEKLCAEPLIVKNRYRVLYEGFTWEIDEFQGENSGLVVAEIELEHPEQVFLLPGWIDREVSGDAKYYNVSLVTCPYSKWHD